MRNQKLFDYFANQHGLVLLDSELHEITIEVCKSIGINSLEPSEWVSKIRKIHSALGLSVDCNSLDFIDAFMKQSTQLQSENERLKAELAKLKGE